MESREQIRLREIDDELARARRRYRQVYSRWATINVQRIQLDHQIKSLMTEKEDLAQGQLLFEKDLSAS